MADYRKDRDNLLWQHDGHRTVIGHLLPDGTVQYLAGMASVHAAAVKELLGLAAKVSPEAQLVAVPAPEDTSSVQEQAQQAAELPPFRPELGVDTPGFQDWIKTHHVTDIKALLDDIYRAIRKGVKW
jgi:hypothetical protein